MNAPTSMPRLRPGEATIAAIAAELQARFGNRAVTSSAVREQHGHTLTWTANEPPDIVVYPETAAEVAGIVTLCARHDVPVIAFGTGTSLEGHVNAPVRRGLGRYQPDEAHRRRSSGGSRLRGRAGRHPQGAERAPARPGPVLPHRSRRRRLPRRHGGDARFRHQCRALRDHARQCPRPRPWSPPTAPRSRRRAGRARARPATTSPACSSARKARSASSPRSP